MKSVVFDADVPWERPDHDRALARVSRAKQAEPVAVHLLKPSPMPVLMPRTPGGDLEPAGIVFAEFDRAGRPVYAAIEFADGHRNMYQFLSSTYACINSGHLLDVFVLHDQHPQNETHRVFSTQTVFSEDGVPLVSTGQMASIGYRFVEELVVSPFGGRMEYRKL